MELDDSSAEGHHALAAFYLFGKWDWRNAETESLPEIALNPNFGEAHHLNSYILTVSQRPDEALQEEKRAMEIDPFARPWALGVAYINARQFDAAINELQLRAQAQPSDGGVHFVLSKAYWLKGMWKSSLQELEAGLRVTGEPEAATIVHRAFEQGGEKAVEEWGVRDIVTRARKGYVAPWDQATQYAFLGDKEKTITLLQDAFRERSAWLVFIQDEPTFDFLHSDPRYQTIVKEMGLPAAH